jgi:hypothetical protein
MSPYLSCRASGGRSMQLHVVIVGLRSTCVSESPRCEGGVSTDASAMGELTLALGPQQSSPTSDTNLPPKR